MLDCERAEISWQKLSIMSGPLSPLLICSSMICFSSLQAKLEWAKRQAAARSSRTSTSMDFEDLKSSVFSSQSHSTATSPPPPPPPSAQGTFLLSSYIGLYYIVQQHSIFFFDDQSLGLCELETQHLIARGV